MQKFPFRMKHKFVVQNKVAEALSHQANLLLTMGHEIVGYFNKMKQLYETDEDFQIWWPKYRFHESSKDFHIYDGFLMKGNQLCNPCSS